MKKVVLATNNKHKIKEFAVLLEGFEILSLNDIKFYEDIVEDGNTFEENAQIKTRTVYNYCKNNGYDYAVVSDDSGLCVDALDGAPGVYSARYSGDHDDEGNRQKVLSELKNKTDRSANMACAICYKDNTQEITVIGRCYGSITLKKIGNEDFGYDPIFFSNELQKTFGEATKAEKDLVSHRGKATQMLLKELSK